MAIFNSYVSLPEGIITLFICHVKIHICLSHPPPLASAAVAILWGVAPSSTGQVGTGPKKTMVAMDQYLYPLVMANIL